MTANGATHNLLTFPFGYGPHFIVMRPLVTQVATEAAAAARANKLRPVPRPPAIQIQTFQPQLHPQQQIIPANAFIQTSSSSSVVAAADPNIQRAITPPSATASTQTDSGAKPPSGVSNFKVQSSVFKPIQ